MPNDPDVTEHVELGLDVDTITAEDAEMLNLLPLVEIGLQNVIDAYEEAGRIEEEETARLNIQIANLRASGDRLRQILAKSTA